MWCLPKDPFLVWYLPITRFQIKPQPMSSNVKLRYGHRNAVGDSIGADLLLWPLNSVWKSLRPTTPRNYALPTYIAMEPCLFHCARCPLTQYRLSNRFCFNRLVFLANFLTRKKNWKRNQFSRCCHDSAGSSSASRRVKWNNSWIQYLTPCTNLPSQALTMPFSPNKGTV